MALYYPQHGGIWFSLVTGIGEFIVKGSATPAANT